MRTDTEMLDWLASRADSDDLTFGQAQNTGTWYVTMSSSNPREWIQGRGETFREAISAAIDIQEMRT